MDIQEFHAEQVLGIEGFLYDMRRKDRSDEGNYWTPEEEKQWAIPDSAREAVLSLGTKFLQLLNCCRWIDKKEIPASVDWIHSRLLEFVM